MAQFSGRVFLRKDDGAIGDGIEGARLEFSGPDKVSATTARNGSYKVTLRTGAYDVVTKAAGFATERTRAILQRDQQTLNVFLRRTEADSDDDAPEVGGFTGRVFVRNTDGSIGDEVAGASIVFLDRGRIIKRLVSGSNGTYRALLSPGRYEVRVRKTGLQDYSGGAIVGQDIRTLNLFLRDPAPALRTWPECGHAGAAQATDQTAQIILPGSDRPQSITFRDVNGLAIADGGIILGKTAKIKEESQRIAQMGSAAPTDADLPDGTRTVRQALIAQSGSDKLWPSGVVRFRFAANVPTQLRNRVEQAIEHIQAQTNITFTNSDGTGDFVTIRTHAESFSSAELGRQGGEQFVNLAVDFDIGGIVHELLHSLGVLHEQSRNDRDAYVTINDGTNGTPDNIESWAKHNFRKGGAGTVDLGPYDYGSIMHYHDTAFGLPGPNNSTLQTIVPTTAGAILSAARSGPPTYPNFLTQGDIDGLNRLYPFGVDFEGGTLWGDGAYGTDIAFGDVDGDGIDEVVVTRRANGNGRYFILDDGRSANHPHSTLFAGGQNWGADAYASSCAVGDIDGDGRAEIAIGRRSGTNHRFALLRYQNRSVSTIFEGGTDWGTSAHTTDLAIARDAAGVGLLAVARRHGSNARFFLYRFEAGTLRLVFSGGQDWGADAFATSIALGDMDGDGRLELAVGRRASGNARFMIYRSLDAGYTNMRLLHSGGLDWGESANTTGLCFGDVDGDGRDELGVTREHATNGRFFVIDGPETNFRTLYEGGRNWGRDYYATGIAMGDIDGDGVDEIVVSRRAGNNNRVFIYDDARTNFLPLGGLGDDWGKEFYPTSVAIGRTRFGTGASQSIGIARRATVNGRFFIHRYR